MSEERRWDCCNQPFGDGTTTCTAETVEIPGAERDEELPSVRYDPDYGGSAQRCHDCHIKPGGYHHPGCDMERCPKCEGQLISCGCISDDAYNAWQRVKTALSASEAARAALVARMKRVEGLHRIYVFDRYICGACKQAAGHDEYCVFNFDALAAQPAAAAPVAGGGDE